VDCSAGADRQTPARGRVRCPFCVWHSLNLRPSRADSRTRG
jgi:hypothetical protein